MNYNIQELCSLKRFYEKLISDSIYDGSVEIKILNKEKYVYIRKKTLSQNKSIYLGKYTDELYLESCVKAKEIRIIKKEIRNIEKSLALKGYNDGVLNPRVILNIEFARINIKSLIYDQAVLEGIGTTFPQTESIIENGFVNNIRAIDVLKIINLKRAWEFITDKDVLSIPCDFDSLCYIAKCINENVITMNGIRKLPVRISGSKYIPPIPNEEEVKGNINNIISSNKDKIDICIDLILYCMKTQIFNDGNKRTSIIFANQYLISNGLGLIAVPFNLTDEFKMLLVSYYEGEDDSNIRTFLKEKCLREF